MFELKEECKAEYNPFYYHYNRVEQSQVFFSLVLCALQGALVGSLPVCGINVSAFFGNRLLMHGGRVSSLLVALTKFLVSNSWHL